MAKEYGNAYNAKSYAKVRAAAPRAGRRAWMGLTLCSLAMGVIYLFRVLAGMAGVGAGEAEVAFFPGVSVVLLTGLSAAAVLLIMSMFADASVARTPFLSAFAYRFVVLGAMLFACALLEALAAIGLSDGVALDSIASFMATSNHFGAPAVEVLLIVAAFVSFSLSYIFKYASFLQWSYDETV